MKALAGLFVALFTISASAEFRDGNKLLAEIKDPDVTVRMLALGYIMGVTDSHNNVTSCPPRNTTAGQIQDMTKEFLEKYPSIRNQTADVLISKMLEQFWPCANRRRGNPA